MSSAYITLSPDMINTVSKYKHPIRFSSGQQDEKTCSVPHTTNTMF